MSNIFEIQADDIADLSDLQLTKLLKLLLHLEARSSGIAERAVEVGLNIRVADGGEDGRIEWTDGPECTSYLPSRLVQFQCKATEMGPTAYGNEIRDSEGSLKKLVEEVLDQGATYVVFTSQKLNKRQKNSRIAAIRKVLVEIGKSYADTAEIEIYDAATIQGWSNRHVSSIISVSDWVGRPLLPGLHTWDSWQKLRENHLFEFVPDDARKVALEQINEILSRPRGAARLIGLSGLGKTRLALEICRGNDDAPSLHSRVVYVDAANRIPNLPGIVASWVQRELDGVVIVDNCDLQLHSSLRRQIEHPDSSMSLLTIHYNPETDSDTHQIQLKAMDDDSIKEMLLPVYGEKIPDLDRVVSFAQGFPQMAYLLAQSRLEESKDMGSLTDDALIDKLLWGSAEKDRDTEKILQGCAIFDKFGFDKEAADESEFIAETIVGTDIDKLHSCIREYQDRGIVNRAGRFAQIVPKPLAIRLAADWWRQTRRRKQETLIETKMPGQLEISFCEQISMLDFLPEVKELTSDLCGKQGPFGQAEVILSDRGSRLFRALVEVNPASTSDALYEVLSNMDFDDLSSIKGDVRRNLVWALEKLCFREDSFPKSARSLMLLAARENEDWGNNATGQFLQLFRVHLSGTSAPPPPRFELIDEALGSQHHEIQELAVKALETAIDTYSGSRMVGAEYQGSGRPLREWTPTIWQEIFDYRGAALERLSDVAIGQSDLRSAAKQAIASHIRGLMQIGSNLMAVLDKVIRRIVHLDGPLWPAALSSIKDSLRFDSKKMPQEGVDKLNEWTKLLSPTDLADRLTLVVSMSAYEGEKRKGERFVDVAAENAEALASELGSNLEVLVPYLEMLLTGEQRQGYWFGRQLVLHAKKWEPLLSKAMEFVANTESTNTSFLLGLLSGVGSINSDHWTELVAEFHKNGALNSHYPNAITTGQITKHHLDCIIDLLDRNALNTDLVSILAMGRALESLKPKDVGEFIEKLRVVSLDGAWRALDILAMYCHGDKIKWKQLELVTKELLLNLDLSRKERRQTLEMFHWKNAAAKMLHTNDAEFATSLVQQIVRSGVEGIEYGDLHFYLKPILRQLLGDYGAETWPVFGEAIISSDPLDRYQLASLLESESKFDRKGSSVLTSIPEDILIEWCKSEPRAAPLFVADAINFLDENDGEYQITSLGRYLIDNYGDNEEILVALSRNMGTFGWTGSVVPYYEKEIKALAEFQSHKSVNVREWADRRIRYLNDSIKAERIQDEEAAWGIR